MSTVIEKKLLEPWKKITLRCKEMFITGLQMCMFVCGYIIGLPDEIQECPVKG